MAVKTITLAGVEYVVLPRADFDRLSAPRRRPDPPSLPKPNARGEVPAVAYGRASIAREIATRMDKAGLSVEQLARAAKVRPATIERLLTGAAAPGEGVVEKLDRVLPPLR